jgi:hypothetical protein
MYVRCPHCKHTAQGDGTPGVSTIYECPRCATRFCMSCGAAACPACGGVRRYEVAKLCFPILESTLGPRVDSGRAVVNGEAAVTAAHP